MVLAYARVPFVMVMARLFPAPAARRNASAMDICHRFIMP